MMAHDLIYCGEDDEGGGRKLADDLTQEILYKFPTAIISRDYDDIHGYRLELDIPDVEQELWYEFAMTIGIHRMCFTLMLDQRMRPEKIKPIVARVVAAKQEKMI